MRVSVVIPARNEEHVLADLLDSLLAQTEPPDEIIVANAGSTDGTAAVARRYDQRGVRLVGLGPAFPGRARNKGIEAARNEWIALADAGCIVNDRWIEALTIAAAGDASVRAVLGQYEPRLATEWDVAQALTAVPPVDPRTQCRPPFIASALLHREAWVAAGRFPEDLRAAEDLVFFERLDAARIPTVRSPAAVVRWSLAPTPAAFFRRLRLYSAHHASAGLMRTWHLRVMAMDATAAALVIVSLLWPPGVLILLVAGAARLLRTVGERRSNVAPRFAFRPDRLVRAAMLLFLADLATWAGWVDYALGRTRRG